MSEDWKGTVKFNEGSVNFFMKYAEGMRLLLDHPKDDQECYSCDGKIEGNAKFIEWIPLFMRYACICDACHEKYGKGEYVEVIKLHGSINWSKENKPPFQVNIWENYSNIPEEHEIHLNPPTWKKDPSKQFAILWKKPMCS